MHSSVNANAVELSLGAPAVYIYTFIYALHLLLFIRVHTKKRTLRVCAPHIPLKCGDCGGRAAVYYFKWVGRFAGVDAPRTSSRVAVAGFFGLLYDGVACGGGI